MYLPPEWTPHSVLKRAPHGPSCADPGSATSSPRSEFDGAGSPLCMLSEWMLDMLDLLAHHAPRRTLPVPRIALASLDTGVRFLPPVLVRAHNTPRHHFTTLLCTTFTTDACSRWSSRTPPHPNTSRREQALRAMQLAARVTYVPPSTREPR
ncbi:hypothetical protein B0H11DRAFT_920458 [Mycena galericulata]|nr:hypothetical protein B0H11DRAFT_920458 [Mycena galericulata]